jgi:mannose-1-phosphate guanylyltransferase
MISVILAGGAGRRFWPLSREDNPKQLLEIWDDQPMIAKTVERTRQVAPSDRILVVCGPHLVDAMKEALPELDEKNFLVEPAPRNTAPAIGLAAAYAREVFGDEPMAIFPSDHYIGNIEAFSTALDDAGELAKSGYIVTLGIEPSRPETGYGYIHYREQLDDGPGFAVESFVEKPDRKTAVEYLESGDYAWNSGMFIFTPSVLFGEMDRQLPEMASSLKEIGSLMVEDRATPDVEDTFKGLQDISIDYGIMEGAEDIAIIPAKFQWSDVGHWGALDEVCETDSDGNITRGDAAIFDTTDSVVFSKGDRFVSTVGLEGAVVVDTDDALLVVSKSEAQNVREVVSYLTGNNRDDLL